MKVTTSTAWMRWEWNQKRQPTEPARGTPIRKLLSIFFFSAHRPAITPRGGATATGCCNREVATANPPFLDSRSDFGLPPDSDLMREHGRMAVSYTHLRAHET